MAVIKKITETINNKKTKPKIGYMNTTNAATTHRMPVPSVNNLGNFSYELFLIPSIVFKAPVAKSPSPRISTYNLLTNSGKKYPEPKKNDNAYAYPYANYP